MWQGVRLWRFCLIKYVHNGPFNEPASFGIPGLIFQAKVTKFGTNVGLQMLINIISGFFHNNKKKISAIFFFILHLCTCLPSSYDSHVGPFFRILQLCTRLPSSYDSDLGPFCSRQLRGLPSSDGYFLVCGHTSAIKLANSVIYMHYIKIIEQAIKNVWMLRANCSGQ